MRLKGVGKASLIGGVIAAACVAGFWRRARRRETERLAAILGWETGAFVADLGAGSGALTMSAARRVGPAGRVFATEIDPKKLNRIRRKAVKRGFHNITAVKVGGGQSGLPRDCCDAALLRGSYHHVAAPAAFTADLYRALRPGGTVAVVDFPPRRWLGVIAPVKGVPADRGGHGIPADVLIREMTAAGFEVQKLIPHWFLDVYCVVFRKPARDS